MSWVRIALLGVIAMFLSAGSCSTQPKPDPKPGSWLVLLCRASDVATEPHPREYYERMFQEGADGEVFKYFKAVSGERTDISGTEVYGWFPMSVTAAEIAPDKRNQGLPVTRAQTAKDCRNTGLAGIIASGFTLEPGKYAGIITVINVPVDSGDAGERSMVLFDQFDTATSFVVHEMFHVLGLPHSRRAVKDTSPDHQYGVPGGVDYRDCWDIMSWKTCAWDFATAAHGPVGPELNGPYLDRLGWMDKSRIDNVTTSRQVTLAPISQPEKAGSLMAKIELPNGAYAVEYRTRTRYDQGIPQAAVSIRELRSNGITYLVERSTGQIGFFQGDQFTDNANWLGIHIDEITPDHAKVTVNMAYQAAPLGSGAMCGNRERGQVLQCAAPLQCHSRQLGNQLQTADWFCQP